MMSEYDDIQILQKTGYWPGCKEPQWALDLAERYDCGSTHSVVIQMGLQAEIERLRAVVKHIVTDWDKAPEVFENRRVIWVSRKLRDQAAKAGGDDE